MVIGSLESFATFSSIVVYLYWSNIPTVYAFIILFEIFHLFSWLATLIIGGGSISIPYITFSLVIYALALVFDLSSLIWRIVLYVDCLVGSCDVNSGFAITELFLTTAFIVIDVVMLVSLVLALAGVRDHVERGKILLQGLAGSDAMTDRFYQVSKLTYYLRLLLGVAWQLDFWISLATEIVIVFGIGVSATFIYAGLFLLPHTFMWLIARAVSGSPILIPSDALQNTEFIFAMGIIYIIPILIDIAGISYIGVEVSQCTTNATPCSDVSLGLGYLVLFLYIALFVIILLETALIFFIQHDYRNSQRFVIFPNVVQLLQREGKLPLAEIARSNRSKDFAFDKAKWNRTVEKVNESIQTTKSNFEGINNWFSRAIRFVKKVKTTKKINKAE